MPTDSMLRRRREVYLSGARKSCTCWTPASSRPRIGIGGNLGKATCSCVLLLMLRGVAVSQAISATNAGGGTSELPKPIKAVFDYLTMAGASTAQDFTPLSQSERNTIYLKSLINPV